MILRGDCSGASFRSLALRSTQPLCDILSRREDLRGVLCAKCLQTMLPPCYGAKSDLGFMGRFGIANLVPNENRVLLWHATQAEHLAQLCRLAEHGNATSKVRDQPLIFSENA